MTDKEDGFIYIYIYLPHPLNPLSLSKERGKEFWKRGFAPLRHPVKTVSLSRDTRGGFRTGILVIVDAPLSVVPFKGEGKGILEEGLHP